MNSIIIVRRFAVAIFVGLLVGVNCQAQSFLTNGLVAYYPFKGNANDITGNGNNGTVNGATLTTNMFGNSNSAYYFNGSSFIDFGSPADLAFQGDFTATAWCYFSGGSQYGRILSYGTGGSNPGYELFAVGTGGSRPFGAIIANTQWWTANNYNQNTWYAVALVSHNGTGYIYVNGVLDGTASHSGLSYQSGFHVGNNSEGGVDYWGGAITDVRLYNTALSSNQIVQLYQIESNPPPTLAITGDLTNTFVVLSSNTSFTVSATSPAPITYQWYFNPTNHAGQAGAYAQIVSGFCVGAVITNGGFGYGNVPAVSFVGGGGSGASGYGTASNGILTSITMISAGSGYTNLPTVVIGPPNGYLYGQTNNTLNIVNANNNDVGSYYVAVSSGGYSITSSIVTNETAPPMLPNRPICWRK